MKITVTESNIARLVSIVEHYIQHGYRVLPMRSYLDSQPFLYEIDMWLECDADVEFATYSEEDALPEAWVNEYDAQKFLLSLQKFVISGYQVELNTLNWSEIGSKIVQVIKPDHEVNIRYTREEIEAMEYEELKRVARLRNCFHKSRNQMLISILKQQGDY